MSSSRVYKNRDLYLNKLIAFQDMEPVKVVTGIRRCGKSSLLKLMIQHLLDTGVPKEQIVEMNFESHDYKDLTSDGLYNHIKSIAIPGKRMYLFFDEIDTGISGQTAWKVSGRMGRLAKDHQILCITHLPQIAAMQDSHYLIAKEAGDDSTATHIRRLQPGESDRELARLLGAGEISSAALENAREMKKTAAAEKEAAG